MARPKHRRCQVCNIVTSRYVGSQNAGAFLVRRWAVNPVAGEVLAVNGTVVHCAVHAWTVLAGKV